MPEEPTRRAIPRSSTPTSSPGARRTRAIKSTACCGAGRDDDVLRIWPGCHVPRRHVARSPRAGRGDRRLAVHAVPDRHRSEGPVHQPSPRLVGKHARIRHACAEVVVGADATCPSARSRCPRCGAGGGTRVASVERQPAERGWLRPGFRNRPCRSRTPSPIRRSYAVLTVERETLSRRASSRLGGRSCPSTNRPSMIAVRTWR